MKELLVILLMVGLAYYAVIHSPYFKDQVIDPYYVEIRIHIPTKLSQEVNLVGIGKMNSLKDCQEQTKIFWEKVFKNSGKVKVNTECKKEIAQKYQKLFKNEQTAATYMVYEKGDENDRDGRFIFYGLPSSLVYGACEKLIKDTKEKGSYSGNIYCIKGSVG